jgi:hypothetical protein
MVGFNFNHLDDDSIDEHMTDEEFELMDKIHTLDKTQAIYHERDKKLSIKEQIKRYEDSHEHPEKWKKLRKYYLEPHQNILPETKAKLLKTINEAENEEPIQNFLAENPYLLARATHPSHHGKILIPKPPLGNQLKPDFLIAGLDSGGFRWYGVELENPKYKMFTQKGEETKELKHAIKQIQDWRDWLKNNIAYAQNTLGYMHIDAKLPCFIILGKRENEVLEEDELLNRRRSVEDNDRCGLMLHHYEWLLDVSPTLIRVTD